MSGSHDIGRGSQIRNRTAPRRECGAEETARAGVSQGERKRRAFGLRHGALPDHALSGAVGKTVKYGRRDPHLHSGKRSDPEEERITRYFFGAGAAGSIFRIAAMRQPSGPRLNRNVLHIWRVAPPAISARSYRPSAMATAGSRKRIDSSVIVRFPPSFFELATVPRTTSS